MASSAERDIEAHEPLKLQADVLADVRQIGPAAQALKEPAGPAHAALVVLQGRQPRMQTLGKSRKTVARPIDVRPDVHQDSEHRHVSEQIVTAESANLTNNNTP